MIAKNNQYLHIVFDLLFFFLNGHKNKEYKSHCDGNEQAAYMLFIHATNLSQKLSVRLFYLCKQAVVRASSQTETWDILAQTCGYRSRWLTVVNWLAYLDTLSGIQGNLVVRNTYLVVYNIKRFNVY